MHEPVFKNVLADDWDKLGSVIKHHYSLMPFSDDYICVTGQMLEIFHSAIAKLFIPFGLLFGAVVPYRAKNIPVDVHYNSNHNNGHIYWDRVFKFTDKKHFHFKSHMEHVEGNEVIEYVRFGVGMRLQVTAEGGALVFRDIGYIWRVGSIKIPIPVNWVFGNAYVEERPVDEDNFTMKMVLTHPLFGVMFRYNGQFSLASGKAGEINP